MSDPIDKDPSATKEKILAAIRTVFIASTSNFLELVTLAGLSKRRDFINADLSGTDLSNLDLRDFCFQGTVFHHCDLRGAKLTGTGFQLRNALNAKTNEKTLIDETLTGASSGEAPSFDSSLEDFLAEIDSIEPLSPEGEIAIAKRMEAGRDKIIGALCESPLTMRGIVHWRDALLEGKLLLRDIIKLEVALGGEVGVGSLDSVGWQATAKRSDKERTAGSGKAVGERGDYDWPWNATANRSLVAMEMKLKPHILEIFDKFAGTYRRMHRMQEKRQEALHIGKSFSPVSERHYQKLKGELAEYLERVPLSDQRIDQLVGQLYDFHHKLTQAEGALLLAAESAGITREEFFAKYQGREVDPRWLSRVGRLHHKGWKKFVVKRKAEILHLRKEIAEISERSGLPITELKKVVSQIQQGEYELNRSRQELVSSNLPLVLLVLDKLAGSALASVTLFQLGKTSLTRAADSFDYRSGRGFSSHATPIIQIDLTSAIAKTPSLLVESSQPKSKGPAQVDRSGKFFDPGSTLKYLYRNAGPQNAPLRRPAQTGNTPIELPTNEQSSEVRGPPRKQWWKRLS